jgi:diguanylate cyclase (GGDEF)-like protein/PAS domain S-box-containing protein
MAVPIIHQEHLIGQLVVGSKTTDYDEKDKELLESIAGHIAPVLNARLQRDKQDRERERAEREVLQTKEYYENLVGNAGDGIIVTDRNQKIITWNHGAERIFGYSQAEALGRKINDLLRGPDKYQEIDDAMSGALTVGETRTFEAERYTKNGAKISVAITATPLRDSDGNVIGVSGIHKDITERKRAEEALVKARDQLYDQAHQDTLTGLPNRKLFYDRLSQAASSARRYERSVALLFIDLDRFKVINDTLGHDVGDLLLQAVGKRLTGCVRESDTVARLGGDEFSVILPSVVDPQDAVRVGQKIVQALSDPFVLDSHELFVTTSVGISMYPSDGNDMETLVKNADIAMYRAKEQGKGNCQLYTPAMNARAHERLTLETSLRRALEREEFLLHYQPRFDLGTGQIVGMEALLRWNRPGLGLVPPGEFVPLLEETGLIMPVGQWVLHTACVQNKAWLAAGLPRIRVAVNVSTRQFSQEDMPETVARELEEVGLEPNLLELELTESTVMHDAEAAIAMLRALKEVGIQISIDDFGTSYSSLNYLTRFPTDTLKVDQSFVREVTTDPSCAAVTEAIVSLAHMLRMKVTAEGVETKEQLAFLRECECDEVQGYLLSWPLTVEAATELLASPQAAPTVALWNTISS